MQYSAPTPSTENGLVTETVFGHHRVRATPKRSSASYCSNTGPCTGLLPLPADVSGRLEEQ
jgi:hypothetical protein